MRAHYFQHVSFEGLGSIAPWLESNNYEITCSRFFESQELPGINQIDLLIIMGGPMSVNEEKKFPWLVEEKKFIKRFIESGKPVLGVCLGAQLIASAMGAAVYKNPVKEIGWFPIQGVSLIGSSAFKLPQTVEVFHWHGETFNLPSHSIRLARSSVCENQAFQFGRSVIGLQFHLESTPESVREIISHCRQELLPSQYIQTEAAILSAEPEAYRTINQLMTNVLTYLDQVST